MNQTHGSWRKGLAIITLCAGAVVASAALRSPSPSESPAPAPQTMAQSSIAIVNLKNLFDGLAEFKEGMSLVEDRKKDAQVKLKEVEAAIKTTQAELDMLKDPPMAEKLDLLAKIAELQALGEARAATLSRVLEVQAGDIMRRVFVKTVDAAKKLSAQDGWDVILIDDRSITPPERLKSQDGKEGRRITIAEVENVIQQRHILTATDRVDITPALIALMNNEFKAGKK